MTNSIKFFWNGLKINGERTLTKCSYSLDNNRDHSECVTIYAKGYSRLPSDLFEVHNDTDIYTDYFDNDSATLTPDHPLYKYARYAAAKAEMRYLPQHIAYLEGCRYKSDVEIAAKKARLAEYEAMENPGQPTADDLAKIDQMRQAAESARIAAEKEAEQKAREAMLAKRAAGRHYINDVAEKNPIRKGEPVVTINWSEHPAFYNWEDNELKLSVAAAEIILSHFDKEAEADPECGYYKTSFTINYVNDDGEQDSYEGRYDLGDDDGGMIAHIRSFGSFYLNKGHFGNGNPSDEDKEIGVAIINFADMLAAYANTVFNKKGG